jgi:hypothetical protein
LDELKQKMMAALSIVRLLHGLAAARVPQLQLSTSQTLFAACCGLETFQFAASLKQIMSAV